MVGKDEVELVLGRRPDRRASSAQTCRQSGLSVVVHGAARLRRRRDLLPARSRSSSARPSARRCSRTRTRAVIGLRPAGGAARCSTRRWTRVIGARRQVIAISEDDDTVRLSGRHRACRSTGARSAPAPSPAAAPGAHADPGLEPARQPRSSASSTTTWRRAREIRVVAEHRRTRRAAARGRPAASRTSATVYQDADTTDRARARRARRSARYDHVIVLCYTERTGPRRRPTRARWSRCSTCATSPTSCGHDVLDRQRDARRAQPRAGRGDARPTTSSSATSWSACCCRRSRENKDLDAVFARPLRPRRLGDLPQAGRGLRAARRAA